jgi:hypothetical protein
MTTANPRIVLAFTTEDSAWLKRNQHAVPRYWEGHGAPPLAGDVIRLGGRQFLIQGRAWEHDADGPLLRVFVGDSHAHSDTVFG